jgi:hypothetical protein
VSAPLEGNSSGSGNGSGSAMENATSSTRSPPPRLHSGATSCALSLGSEEGQYARGLVWLCVRGQTVRRCHRGMV